MFVNKGITRTVQSYQTISAPVKKYCDTDYYLAGFGGNIQGISCGMTLLFVA